MSQENETKRKQIVVSEVLDLLNSGKTRKEIAEHYGKPLSVMNATVFKHPEIKNIKTKKELDFEIVDDLTGGEVVVTHASKFVPNPTSKEEEVVKTQVEVTEEKVEEVVQEEQETAAATNGSSFENQEVSQEDASTEQVGNEVSEGTYNTPAPESIWDQPQN